MRAKGIFIGEPGVLPEIGPERNALLRYGSWIHPLSLVHPSDFGATLRAMSEHQATLTWTRGDSGFGYKEYPRTHEWRFPESGQTVRAAAAVEYLGTPDCVDPEEAFTAALSSCHMLTFLAIAARKRLVVDSYRDTAVGHLEKDAGGKLSMTRVTLRPAVTFAEPPTPDVLDRLHHRAHEECFIARSVKTEVTIEPV
jgi:organic hydroperoxide reductase OsmC/OhrA